MTALIMKEIYFALTAACLNSAQSKERHVPPPPSLIFTRQSVTETDDPTLTHTILTYRLAPCFLRFDGIAASTPAILKLPTQKLTERKAVKRVCAPRPGGIKDVEGLQRIKAGVVLSCLHHTSFFLWAFFFLLLSFTVHDKWWVTAEPNCNQISAFLGSMIIKRNVNLF